MYETLLRPHQVDAVPALTPIGAVGERLKQAEARREEKRLRQIANARAGAERRAAKRKAEDDGALEEAEGKRAKTDGEDDEHVPPELIDLMVNNFRYDEGALYSCVLVCRAWYLRYQRLLSSKVSSRLARSNASRTSISCLKYLGV